MTTRPVLLHNLPVGEAFTFTAPTGPSPVYIRVRGGYRPGRGGPLVAFSMDQKVYRFSLHDISKESV